MLSACRIILAATVITHLDSPLNSLQSPIWIFWIAFVCEKIFQIQQRLLHHQIPWRCVFFLLFHRFFEFIFFIWTSYYKTKYILWKRMKISITLYCPTRHCLLFDYKYSTCYRCNHVWHFEALHPTLVQLKVPNALESLDDFSVCICSSMTTRFQLHWD